ncbi:hypothetical protein KP509_25G058600 [Ceratopteris richardii]|uniref:HMA domain-containing protein n=1 Tax=Ceratopteris richardii TaxID=49495 RepID=A0A8T2RRH9_CERRI|nr:hypothetical protein KP509_25G058600 [Ceratopteris richardii]
MSTTVQTVELKVKMNCQGCVGAVKRVLGRMVGVEKYEVDLQTQKVTVTGIVQVEVQLKSRMHKFSMQVDALWRTLSKVTRS